MLQPTQPLQIDLPVDMISSLHQMVEQQDYHSADEIVYDALLSWQRRQQILTEELKKLWDEGMVSGDGGELDMDAIIAEAKQERASNMPNI